LTTSFLLKKINTHAPDCQVLNPVVREALSLGLVIASVETRIIPGESEYLVEIPRVGRFPKAKLPAGHRFYPDCYREQEARLISWLLYVFRGDTWFFTLTFKDWISVFRAERIRDRFLARLNQAYLELPGAELLRSISSSEWQNREVIHFHMLVFGKQLHDLSRKRWEHRWLNMSGGLSRCYQAGSNSAPYLVKHQVRNHPDSSLNLGGSWRGITPPKSIERCCSAPRL
jgi:hypothetical protein